tara:strand:+ start:789 stop:956 length:168 start_codon:yes stop_codon:yes gene_type:complete
MIAATPPEYDSPEMNRLIIEENKSMMEKLGRPMNATEEHLCRQWKSGYHFSTIGD